MISHVFLEWDNHSATNPLRQIYDLPAVSLV
jgi:hypothetical protein